MTRRQRNWLIALGSTAAVIAVAVALFDWNWFRPIVEARAGAAIGRSVNIGHLDVQQLSRRPLVVLDRVSVDNPRGFPADSKFTEIERIAAQVDVIDLIRGRLTFPALTVDRLIARMEPGPDGAPNWKLGGQANDHSGAPGSGPEIGQLTINDSHVSLRNPEIKAEVEMDVRTEPDPKGGPNQIMLKGTGKYAGAPTKIQVRAGSLLELQQADVKYPVDLQWEVGPTRVKLTGSVRNPMNFAGLDGNLDLRGPDLAELYPLIGVPLPPSPPYHLTGHVTYADKQVRFEKFNGGLGGSDLSGTLNVDTRNPRLRLDGDLVSNKVVLDDLAGFIGAVPGKKGAPKATKQAVQEAQQKASDRALPNNPIDLQKINAIDAHVSYKGKRIEDEYLPLDNLVAKLDLENGRLTLSPLNFGIGQGSIGMKVDIDARAAPPRVGLDAEFRNVDLKRIMQQTELFEGFGHIGGRAKLVSAGSSVAEILGKGDGQLTAVMSGGQMSALLVELVGIDLAEALGIEVADRSKQYPIRCMVADTELRQGVLGAKTLVVDTTDTNIIAGGSINFRDESMQLRLEPHPKDVSILTFRTPVNITGTLKHPKVAPDAAITGGRIAAMIGLGIVATPLAALIPTIELGLGKDSDCNGLIAQAQQTMAKPKPETKPPAKSKPRS